jgi:hypothetical protein
MADDTEFDPRKKFVPPPIPDAAQRTTVEGPPEMGAFAPPPKVVKAKFEAPPATPSKFEGEAWLTGKVDYARGNIASGPPPILLVVCLGWVSFTLFQLWAWMPEEVIVPGCPGAAGIVTLLLAVYAWSGRNLARLFAMINAVAWCLAVAILMQNHDLAHPLPQGTKALALTRAAFELFAAFALSTPRCAAYFELKKPFAFKM